MFYFSKFNAGGNATAVGRRKRSESESGRARAAATENLESGTCTDFASTTGMDDFLLVMSVCDLALHSFVLRSKPLSL